MGSVISFGEDFSRFATGRKVLQAPQERQSDECHSKGNDRCAGALLLETRNRRFGVPITFSTPQWPLPPAVVKPPERGMNSQVGREK
jgi:hypothetical protein